MVHLMEACLLTALQAYLLGSLLFGVLVSKLFYHDDVRLHGSGNAGMTNVLRTYGKLPAVITTIGDVGKSVVAVKLGQFIFDSLLSGTGADFQPLLQPICGAYLAAIFCMLGHSKPVFFGLRGGKGVKNFKITPKTGAIVGVEVVHENQELMLITSNGIVIRTDIESIGIKKGRNTSGVKIQKLEGDDKVAALDTITVEGEEDSQDTLFDA